MSQQSFGQRKSKEEHFEKKLENFAFGHKEKKVVGFTTKRTLQQVLKNTQSVLSMWLREKTIFQNQWVFEKL